MRSWLTYTAARVGLFLAAFGVVYLFGARSWIALILAWLISGLASYVLLSRLRDQLSTSAVERLEQRRGANVGDRLVGGASREDDLQEAADPAPDARTEAPGADAGTDAPAPDAGAPEAPVAPGVSDSPGAVDAADAGTGDAKDTEGAATASKDS